MHALELKIPPILVLALFAIMALGLATLLPGTRMPLPVHPWLAVATAVMAVAVALAGVLEFRRAKTTVNPLNPEKATTVVDSGIFHYTRNPMYLGMALALLAVVLWLQSGIGLVLVPAFCIYLTLFQIKPEERALQHIFGSAFDTYMGKVRRWI